VTRPVAALLAATPSAALACATCARDGAPGTWLLVGALIAAPYLVAVAVASAVRRADRGGP
jgi:hypothetical protein